MGMNAEKFTRSLAQPEYMRQIYVEGFPTRGRFRQKGGPNGIALQDVRAQFQIRSPPSTFKTVWWSKPRTLAIDLTPNPDIS
jgi:hypothetical protein